MDLYQMDFELRAPYAENPSGYYYWTNTYYFYWDGVPGVGTPPYEIGLAILHGHSTAVQRSRVVYTSPPHSGIVMGNFGLLPTHCENAGVGPFILENVARVSLWVGQQYVGYKLLRGAVGTAQVTDGLIDPTVRAYLQGEYADQVVSGGATTADGTAITSAVVDSRIHTWQLRHGTKRRQRVVLAP